MYFLTVFGAGFLLGMIRVPFLVPRLGERMAELLEMPVMLVVIVWSSRWLVLRHAELTRLQRLASGGLALCLLLASELVLATVISNQSIAQYIASRDPVSGSVYLICLVFFALAPVIWTVHAQRESS